MNEENKCFICGRPAFESFTMIIEDGSMKEETNYICKKHNIEYQSLKKKKKPRVDFH